MIKKLLMLTLLLLLTVLVGKIVVNATEKNGEKDLYEEETHIEEYIIIHDNFILAMSPPTYDKPEIQVLSACLSEIEYMSILSKYDWNVNIAQAVMQAESGSVPTEINPHDYHRSANCWGSYGLMQMGCLHIGKNGLTWDNVYDPEANILAAYLLWKQGGWSQWGAYTDGRYKKYLK